MSKVTPQRVLCEVVNTYFQSKRAVDIMQISAVLEQPITAVNSIALQTAQRWLGKMGLVYGRDKKGYVDGHKREDVVVYRQNVFWPKWQVRILYHLSFHYILSFNPLKCSGISKEIPELKDCKYYDC